MYIPNIHILLDPSFIFLKFEPNFKDNRDILFPKHELICFAGKTEPHKLNQSPNFRRQFVQFTTNDRVIIRNVIKYGFCCMFFRRTNFSTAV
jgi:hypothetical protein